MQGYNSYDEDGELEDYGRLITAAFGLDRSWMDGAECRRYAVSRNLLRTPWHVGRDEVFDGDIKGRELIKAALMICSSCAAQYACAEYAVKGLICGGTWGMDIGDLRWLQKQPDSLELIEVAAGECLPVQVAITRTRADRTAGAVAVA